MAFINCDTCNCKLREEDGPTCATCLAERRSEAARAAANARWEQERKDEEPKKS